ncbi:thiamine phosphate synthase [Maricaulaceae bacterium MS644]
MVVRTYDGLARLARRAQTLRPDSAAAPALFILTDPARTRDSISLAERVPEGCGLILRTYGRASIEAAAFPLAEVARARGFALLISADPQLALRAGAHGVHWPQWSLSQAHRPWPGALVTASAHDPHALRRAQTFADAVLVSTVFPSQSPSAGRPMGAFRLAAWARRSAAPVYGLGGVNDATIRRLRGLAISGVAVVGAAGCAAIGAPEP